MKDIKIRRLFGNNTCEKCVNFTIQSKDKHAIWCERPVAVKPAIYITNKSSGRHQVRSKYSRYDWSKFVAKDPDLFRSRASGHAPATESDSHELKLTTIRRPTGRIN